MSDLSLVSPLDGWLQAAAWQIWMVHFILLHPSSTGKSDHLLFLRMRWIVRFEVVDLRALYFLKGSAGLRWGITDLTTGHQPQKPVKTCKIWWFQWIWFQWRFSDCYRQLTKGTSCFALRVCCAMLLSPRLGVKQRMEVWSWEQTGRNGSIFCLKQCP